MSSSHVVWYVPPGTHKIDPSLYTTHLNSFFIIDVWYIEALQQLTTHVLYVYVVESMSW